MEPLLGGWLTRTPTATPGSPADSRDLFASLGRWSADWNWRGKTAGLSSFLKFQYSGRFHHSNFTWTPTVRWSYHFCEVHVGFMFSFDDFLFSHSPILWSSLTRPDTPKQTTWWRSLCFRWFHWEVGNFFPFGLSENGWDYPGFTPRLSEKYAKPADLFWDRCWEPHIAGINRLRENANDWGKHLKWCLDPSGSVVSWWWW